MAISAETEAIIDRLKAEGQLTRNSGSHSIRSVKIQLEKFEGVFNSISGNIAEQTQLLRKQMGIQEEAIERQQRRDDLNELQPPVQPEIEETETDTTITDSDGKKSKGLIEMISGFGGSLLGMMKPLLLGSAGLFVAYNFAKGFIDEKTGGGFTAFETSMIKTFKEVDWSALGTSFVTFATKIPEAVTAITDFISSPLGMILAGAGLTAAGIMSGFAGGSLAKGVTAGIIQGVLGAGGGGGPAGQGAPAGLLNLRKVLKVSALGALTGALVFYGEDISNWLQTQGMSEGWADFAVDSATAISGALTLGAMFGPPGLLVGAVAGIAYVAGKTLYNWFKRNQADAEKKLADRLALADILEGNLGSLENYDDAVLRAARMKRPNTEGVAGSASADKFTKTTDAEQMAIAANLYDDFDETLKQAAEGDKAAVNDVIKMLDQATIQRFIDRFGPMMAAQRGQLTMLGDNLGEVEGDEAYNKFFSQLEELNKFVELSGNDTAILTMRNELRNSILRSFQGITSTSEDFEFLTDDQKRILKALEEIMNGGPAAQKLSSLAGSAATQQMLADAAMGNSGTNVVIGKVGGDTIQNTQITKGGAVNIADVKSYNQNGNPMSPMKLSG
jgi:hypothetical protein